MKIPIEAARERVGGSAIVTFVVMPNGRVDRDTRTLVYVDGHQIYAKYVCDYLLAARFTPAPTDPRGAIGTQSFSFDVAPGIPGPAQDRFFEAMENVSSRVRQMTPEQGRAWFIARPNCSAIKIGLDPLYKPPG